jgi:hypothetical protein
VRGAKGVARGFEGGQKGCFEHIVDGNFVYVREGHTSVADFKILRKCLLTSFTVCPSQGHETAEFAGLREKILYRRLDSLAPSGSGHLSALGVFYSPVTSTPRYLIESALSVSWAPPSAWFLRPLRTGL